MPERNEEPTRPVFPKRAVVTGGMPYGNKSLHLGHVGGVFVFADIFARFLRDRIGAENVIFVSGTDCYGSPIIEYHRQALAAGTFQGDLESFVRSNHERQKSELDAYEVSANLYAASALGRSGEIHRGYSREILETLYRNGYLRKISSPQFFDPELKVFLNGRQVLGRCPIPGCKSTKAYADECELGHPYEPRSLIAPKSTLSGAVPEMRDVTNWYIDLPRWKPMIEEWTGRIEKDPATRPFVTAAIREFLGQPLIYVKLDQGEALEPLLSRLPAHRRLEDDKTIPLAFEDLESRDRASEILRGAGIRFREGKTLTPFRLTGNVAWSIPAPEFEGLAGLTFWVWPESLWAPISFTKTYLESRGEGPEEWKRYWCSRDAEVYQFIGEDNIYFYAIAELAIFMGLQGKEPSLDAPEGELRMPNLVPNKHILQFDKKASSSGDIKPIMALDLLEHYTPDQLRAHFFALGLALRSVNFQPKPFNPKAKPGDADPVLKEGNLLSNVANRLVRSCFYTTQKYFGGKYPEGEVDPEVLGDTRRAALAYELAMSRKEFHTVMADLDGFIRNASKYWANHMNDSTKDDPEAVRRAVVNTFHYVRTVALLLHPIAPAGTSRIQDYLNVGDEFWSWDRAFDPIPSFFKDGPAHEMKFLEPRVDFFEKHWSQVEKA